METRLPSKPTNRFYLSIPGLRRPAGSFTGVCAGLARYMGVRSSLVRIGYIVATPLTSGISILVYAGLAFFLPKDHEEREDTQPGEGEGQRVLSYGPPPQSLCANCDTVSHPYARFCHRCGQELPKA